MKLKLLKHKRKTDRQKTIKRLDNLFSEYIRRRAMKEAGGCERCGHPKSSWKELDCAHFHTRGKYTIRWHELNSAGLCGGCHMFIDSHAAEKIAFFKARMTEHEFQKLNITAEMTSKSSSIDYGLAEVYLRHLLLEVDLESPPW